MVFGRRKKDSAPPTAPPPAPPAAPSAAEQARATRRENDRTARTAARTMDAELRRLKTEENKIKAEMKQLARQGRVSEAKILSKNLVANRKFQERCMTSKYHVSSVVTQANLSVTMGQQAEIVGTAAGVMAKANAAGDPAGMMAAVQRYELESGKAELNQEMMDDALDSAFGGVEHDEESDNILNEVLAEAGLEVGAKVGAVGPTPVGTARVGASSAEEEAAEAAELERRFAALNAPGDVAPGGGQ